MNYEELAENLFQQLKINASEPTLVETLNDFNHGEVGVLSYLAFDKDESTPGELSEKLNVSTARIASILNSLENKEYIKRKDNNLDKRKTLVVITEKGKELATEVKQEIINKIINVIKELGYERINEYINIALEIKNIINKQ